MGVYFVQKRQRGSNMDLLHSMTFTFLTLDQLNKLEAIDYLHRVIDILNAKL